MQQMTRDEIKSFFNLSDQIESAVGGMPYNAAKTLLGALNEMRSLVGEQLPGGYYGTCIGCEEVKGEDEMVSCGDENLCGVCAKQGATA